MLCILSYSANQQRRQECQETKLKNMVIRCASPLAIVLLILAASVGCQPRQVDPTLIGKLVIDTSCGHFVVELLQGTADASHFVPEWRDSLTNIVYVNVFGIANQCNSGLNGLSTGDRFSFEFDPHPSLVYCPICNFAYPSPPIVNAVKNVKKIN
jgi:hypothetical protein